MNVINFQKLSNRNKDKLENKYFAKADPRCGYDSFCQEKHRSAVSSSVDGKRKISLQEKFPGECLISGKFARASRENASGNLQRATPLFSLSLSLSHTRARVRACKHKNKCDPKLKTRRRERQLNRFSLARTLVAPAPDYDESRVALNKKDPRPHYDLGNTCSRSGLSTFEWNYKSHAARPSRKSEAKRKAVPDACEY